MALRNLNHVFWQYDVKVPLQVLHVNKTIV